MVGNLRSGFATSRLEDHRPMDHRSVNEHGDERPSLFRIPSPVASPGEVRPHGTDEDAGREAEDRRVQEKLREVHQRLAPTRNAESQDAVDHHHCKERVREHDHRDMDSQERRLEDWLKGRFGCDDFGHDKSQDDDKNRKETGSYPAINGESSYHLVPKGTEISILLEEERDHAEQQECVAGIGDTDTPRVVVIREGHAHLIAVVVRLAEPIAAVLEGFVHAHGAFVDLHLVVRRPGTAVQEAQFRDEIHRVAFRIVEDLKIPKEEADGSIRDRERLRFVRAQVYLPLNAEEMRHTRPHDNDRKGYVQHICKRFPTKSH